MSSKNSYGSVPTTEDQLLQPSSSSSVPPVVLKKKKCNDVLFGLLFWIHIGLVAMSWWTSYTPSEFITAGKTSQVISDRGVWKYVGIVTLCSMTLSTLSIIFMTAFSDELIEVALAIPIIGTGYTFVYGLITGVMWMVWVGVVGFLMALVLACWVRNKIDFAASNLRTALTVIRTNFGLILHAYFLELVAFAWTVLWLDATMVIMMNAESTNNSATNTEDFSNSKRWLIFCLYLLSFFWTHQVINNIQHVVVASVTGAWWYKPEEANECWDDGLNKAILHTWTYSFGSICMGSLLASLFQSLKWIHRIFNKRETRLQRCLGCCIDCCLSFMQNIVEYFNKWAYAYVGLHGESYLTSGKEVIKLFEVRNWQGIISDFLADAVMFFMKCSVALMTGLLGWWLVNAHNDIFEGVGIDSENDDFIGFCAGALIGYVIASIMMELVASAVDAVIVCFAEAPAVFYKHHPELCKEMLDAWVKAYPLECSDDFTSVKEYSVLQTDYNKV